MKSILIVCVSLFMGSAAAARTSRVIVCEDQISRLTFGGEYDEYGKRTIRTGCVIH